MKNFILAYNAGYFKREHMTALFQAWSHSKTFPFFVQREIQQCVWRAGLWRETAPRNQLLDWSRMRRLRRNTLTLSSLSHSRSHGYLVACSLSISLH